MKDYPIDLQNNKTLNSILNINFNEVKDEDKDRVLSEIETDISIEDKPKKLYYLLKFCKNLNTIINTIGGSHKLHKQLKLNRELLEKINEQNIITKKLTNFKKFILKFEETNTLE